MPGDVQSMFLLAQAEWCDTHTKYSCRKWYC